MRPVGCARRDVADLEVLAPSAARARCGLVLERARLRVVGRDAAVTANGSETSACPNSRLDLGERQHAFDAAAALGVEEIRAWPKALDDLLPAGAVKVVVAAALDERIPARRGGAVPHVQRLHHVDPQASLADVLARIADHKITGLIALLPWNWRSAIPVDRAA